MSFCSLIKGITPKILMLGFVLINSVIVNHLCVWVQYYQQQLWLSLWKGEHRSIAYTDEWITGHQSQRWTRLASPETKNGQDSCHYRLAVSSGQFTIYVIFYICIMDYRSVNLFMFVVNVNVLAFLLYVFKLMSLILVKLNCPARDNWMFFTWLDKT